MDAVEVVMQSDGYAALSARSVAKAAGLKYQIVFYYFETMEDLILETYRRRIQRVLERTEEALKSERPLHAFWEASRNPSDSALSMEFMAMSNHNQAVRAETMALGEHLRMLVAKALSGRVGNALEDGAAITPAAVSMAFSAVAGVLGFEAALGISAGHVETEALVDWCLTRLEPPVTT